MTTSKILPFPAIDIVLDAPPVLKASENQIRSMSRWQSASG